VGKGNCGGLWDWLRFLVDDLEALGRLDFWLMDVFVSMRWFGEKWMNKRLVWGFWLRAFGFESFYRDLN